MSEDSPLKSPKHWVSVVVLLLIGFGIGAYLDKSADWVRLRYSAYMKLQALVPRVASTQKTTVLLIGDDEFWGPELAGRAPTRRDYLARLIDALHKLSPQLIALDFDFRSPFPDGSVSDDPAYASETKELVDAIKRAAATGCPVVVPKTIEWKDEKGYRVESDIFNGTDFPAEVIRGYIALPFDPRRAPVYAMDVGQPTRLLSFAQAASNEPINLAAENDEGHSLPFSGFVPAEKILTLKAGKLLAGDPETMKAVRSSVILVGAGWHSRAHGRGKLVDSHVSPVGEMPAVFLHANYVAAIRDHRILNAWPEWLLHTVEAVLAIIVGLPFAFQVSFGRKILAVIGLCVFALVITILSLAFFGAYFDCLIPALVLIAHGTLEQVNSWRHAAHQTR